MRCELRKISLESNQLTRRCCHVFTTEDTEDAETTGRVDGLAIRKAALGVLGALCGEPVGAVGTTLLQCPSSRTSSSIWRH